MRGTQPDSVYSEDAVRFIPAYAGNTPIHRRSAGSVPVHPRVCGEHAIAGIAESEVIGSSPRMRGTRRGRKCYRNRSRFIPAYAGNTLMMSSGCGGSTVHPRVCGEHAGDQAYGKRIDGSSPRMRGTQPALNCLRWFRRFIPAYAGNTPETRFCIRPSTVHPRVCGEHCQ